MKRITENTLHSEFSGSAVVDRVRDAKSSMLMEQLHINKEFNSPLTPALLYNYYISVCMIRSYDLTNDIAVGRQLGYPAKTIGNVRRKLQKASWVHFEKFKHGGKTYGHWYIGKEVVIAYKHKKGDLTVDEMLELGLVTAEEHQLTKELDDIHLPY